MKIAVIAVFYRCNLFNAIAVIAVFYRCNLFNAIAVISLKGGQPPHACVLTPADAGAAPLFTFYRLT